MVTQGLTGRDLRNSILFAAFIYLIFRFISQIIDIVLIFSVTALLAVALNPGVSWLEKHKIPRGLSRRSAGAFDAGHNRIHNVSDHPPNNSASN